MKATPAAVAHGERPPSAAPAAPPGRPARDPKGTHATVAIQVKIPTILRTYTDGSKTVSGDGATLGALLDDLDAHHPGLKGRLVQDDGSLHRFVNIYVNDEDVRFSGGLDTTIADGDSVTILPAVAGG